MRVTQRIKKILSSYESDNPGTKSNLARILMEGKLGGSGHLIILPVDQGFAHGPARSFAKNPAGYDPQYHFQLALDAGLNALAAPLGILEAGADTFAGAIPLILKVNSSNSLTPFKNDTAHNITASVKDALRLGCVAIGCTIYPGSDEMHSNYEEIRVMVEEAKAHGLAVIVWSYPRGGDISKEGETALDIVAYGVHMAALMGAHIICVKLPTTHIEQADAKKIYHERGITIETLSDRIRHVRQASFNGRRIVLFAGGETKSDEEIFGDIRSIRDGGGHGCVMGRNSFQRPYEPAMQFLDQVIKIYQGKA